MADVVRILSAEPDLGRFLSPDERSEAAELRVPVIALARGALDAGEGFARSHAFGAIVVEGMLTRAVELGSSPSMRLFGPGDLLGPNDFDCSSGHEARMSALEGTRVALLRGEFLRACGRWPGLAAGLHVRAMEQAERLAQQLAICQLPRVDDRLLALLWWLAEVWGRVSSVGTIVPLTMTHDVLGSLVGARRPTVTLALGQLVERGAIARQDRGWLLVEPPAAAARPSSTDAPVMLSGAATPWHSYATASDSPASVHAELLATVQQLRAEHAGQTAAVEARLRDVRAGRERMLARRRARLTP